MLRGVTSDLLMMLEVLSDLRFLAVLNADAPSDLIFTPTGHERDSTAEYLD
jgi:hypothetical protein